MIVRNSVPLIVAICLSVFMFAVSAAADVPFSGVFDEDELTDAAADVRQTILAAEAGGVTQTYPIILVPGYLGTDQYDVALVEMDYWYNIEEALEDAGYVEVHVADITAVGYSSAGPITQLDWYEGETYDAYIEPDPDCVGRSHELKEIVTAVLADNLLNASKVNIIAHSQGALTSRWMISQLGMADQVNALITLSGANKGVDLTKLAVGEVSLPSFIIDPVESALSWVIGGVTDSSETSDVRGSHIEMWPEYTENVFNPHCPDMQGVKYFSFSGKMNATYMLSEFWLIHSLYQLDYFNVASDDGLVSVHSTKGPFHDDPDPDIADNWTWMGEVVGKKVIPGTGIESDLFGVYWGVDHGEFMNFPMGLTEVFHFDTSQFYIDCARLLDAYSD